MKKICSSIILIILLIQITTLSLATEVNSAEEDVACVAYDKKKYEDMENEQEMMATEYTELLKEQIVDYLNPGDMIEEYNVVGRINIPELDINIPILNEMTNRSIELGATQNYTTEKLNKPGNTVILANNNDLNNLKNNNSIEINDENEKVTYVIYEKFETTEEDKSFYYKDANETDGKAEIALIQITESDSRNVFLAKETEREEINLQQANATDEEPSDGWTDFSNAEISFELNSTGVKTIIKGITWNEKHTYKIGISTQKDDTGEEDAMGYFVYDRLNSYAYTTLPNKAMALNKDYYYKIMESAESKKREIKYDEKIVFSLPKYGTRLDMWLYLKNKCSGTQSVLNTIEYKRKMHYKIGKITDNNILKKFKTNQDQAFIDLYNYAKNATPLTTGTIDLGTDSNFNPASQINTTNAYYYAYLSLDDESGKYYPIDDIAIYQGSSDGQTMFHFEFASINVSDDGDSGSGSADPTVAQEKYPFTGRILLGTSITILLGATYVFYKKNKKLDDVK